MYAEMPLITPGDDLDLVKRRIMAEGQVQAQLCVVQLQAKSS